MKIEIKLEYKANDSEMPWCASSDTPWGYMCARAESRDEAEARLIDKAKIAFVDWRPSARKEVEI